jgi:NTE family protein
MIKQLFKLNNSEEIKYPNMLETLVQTIAIMQESIYEYKIKGLKNIIEIKPDLDDYKLTDFTKAKEIVEIGYKEGIKIIKEAGLG